VPFNIEQLRAMYQRWAKHYDLVVKLYVLIGLRWKAYRLRAVELLQLRRGDCVVDLGCGTGLNFPLLLGEIGPEGRLIGVDLSSDMLRCARQRADAAGWANVELVEGDMLSFEYPDRTNGIIVSGALGYVSEYEQVIRAASNALAAGGRFVVLDGKEPEHWPSWLIRIFLWLLTPFGISHEYLSHATPETVEQYFRDTSYEELYGGVVYISSGLAPSRAT
jgi:demethylmenaquinone methyltransferase/2-methoxy-6-polyprenyl-1,4-benzoquinol methylase